MRRATEKLPARLRVSGERKKRREIDKLKKANEKEEERFHREKMRDGGAVLSPRTDKE